MGERNPTLGALITKPGHRPPPPRRQADHQVCPWPPPPFLGPRSPGHPHGYLTPPCGPPPGMASALSSGCTLAPIRGIPALPALCQAHQAAREAGGGGPTPGGPAEGLLRREGVPHREAGFRGGSRTPWDSPEPFPSSWFLMTRPGRPRAR